MLSAVAWGPVSVSLPPAWEARPGSTRLQPHHGLEEAAPICNSVTDWRRQGQESYLPSIPANRWAPGSGMGLISRKIGWQVVEKDIHYLPAHVHGHTLTQAHTHVLTHREHGLQGEQLLVLGKCHYIWKCAKGPLTFFNLFFYEEWLGLSPVPTTATLKWANKGSMYSKDGPGEAPCVECTGCLILWGMGPLWLSFKKKKKKRGMEKLKDAGQETGAHFALGPFCRSVPPRLALWWCDFSWGLLTPSRVPPVELPEIISRSPSQPLAWTWVEG